MSTGLDLGRRRAPPGAARLARSSLPRSIELRLFCRELSLQALYLAARCRFGERRSRRAAAVELLFELFDARGCRFAAS